MENNPGYTFNPYYIILGFKTANTQVRINEIYFQNSSFIEKRIKYLIFYFRSYWIAGKIGRVPDTFTLIFRNNYVYEKLYYTTKKPTKTLIYFPML